MRGLCCRSLMLICLATLGNGSGHQVEAGLIPWGYNAIFGYGPAFPRAYNGYAYNSGYGLGYGGPVTTSAAYAPVWPAYSNGYSYSTSYGPVFGVASYGIASYGVNYGYGSTGDACNPCAPCSNPCDPCGNNCASGNCANGNCGGVNCGAGYTPPISNGPTPEPTRAKPTNPPAANPPANNPPADFRRDPPIDDFTPGIPRTNDYSTPPVNPNRTPPASSIPPASTNPGGSSIPSGNTPPASTVPPINSLPGSSIPRESIPNTPVPNSGGTAPPFGGFDDGFRTPMNRAPAPVDPAGATPAPIPNAIPNSNPNLPTDLDEVLPNALRSAPAPIDLDAVPVASVRVQRQRIQMNVGYHTPALSRLHSTPASQSEIELARK